MAKIVEKMTTFYEKLAPLSRKKTFLSLEIAKMPKMAQKRGKTTQITKKHAKTRWKRPCSGQNTTKHTIKPEKKETDMRTLLEKARFYAMFLDKHKNMNGHEKP